MHPGDQTVSGYDSFGGSDSETAAVRNVLAHHELIAPHTGEPFSEELLFGVGGGIGAGYMMFRICDRVVVWFGTRGAGHTSSTSPSLIEGLAQRLGVVVERKEAGGIRAAEANLRESLQAGHPVICWGDRALMPYNALSRDLAGWFVHVFVVHGLAGDDVLIGTRSKRGAVVSYGDLVESRRRIGSLKNRSLVLIPPRRIGITVLRKAVREGLASCVESCGPQKIKNYGLSSLGHVAEMARHGRDKKGWPRALARPEDLFSSMSSIFQAIETSGTGGGGHRKMFSRFLVEAAEILNKPALEDVAQRYKKLARRWKALAKACLPDEVDELGATRRLHVEAKKLFRRDAMGSLAERVALREQAERLAEGFRERDPIGPEERLVFYESVARRLDKLRLEEVDAVAELAGVLGL